MSRMKPGRKPLIAITMTTNGAERDASPSRNASTSLAYTDAIANAGGIPVLVPECCIDEYADLCDALLLSGGQDVDPSLYGEAVYNDTVVLDIHRDEYEIALAMAFLARQKPILTICRGFQVLNVVLGGSLYQDLTDQLGFIHSDGRIRHPLMTEEDSILRKLFGDGFKVNSTHHQAVKELGKGLRITGRSVEGIVESYESTDPDQFIWGTQFHPERLTGVLWDRRTPDFGPYFAAFIEAVRAQMKE